MLHPSRAHLAAAAIWLAALPAHALAQPRASTDAAAAIAAADRDFNEAVARRDRQKFLSFIAEDAVFVGTGPMRGPDAILKGWDPFFQADGPTLTWAPDKSEVLVGGDVGYTVGSWVRRSKDASGRTTEARGQYVTTWQKQKDGQWKIVFDIGSQGP
jgi:uncharacterized protein (TIGR02246 family)